MYFCHFELYNNSFGPWMQLNKAIQQYKETEEEFMTKQKKGNH
jgi:hypothetical protein